MKRSLMDILCCPVCKGDLVLRVDAEDEKEILEGNLSLRCLQCGLSHPRGIPNLLPPTSR